MNHLVRVRPHELRALRELITNVDAMAIVLWPTGDIKRTILQNATRAVEEMMARIERGDAT